MAAPTTAELIAEARALRDRSGASELQTKNKQSYRPLYTATDELVGRELNEELSRGEQILYPSSYMIKLDMSVRARTRAYPRYPVVYPSDASKESTADAVEKWLTVWLATCNEGMKVSDEVTWHMGNSSHCVALLRYDHDKKEYSVELPDPGSCYFYVNRPPFVPETLVREFSMAVREAEKTYSGKKGKHANAGKQLYYEGKKLTPKWIELSDDYPEDGWKPTGSGDDGYGKLVHFIEIMKAEYTAIIALDGASGLESASEGEEVWREDNPFKRVPAVVMSGFPTPIRDPKDRMRPAYWAGFIDVAEINRQTAALATRSERNLPDVFEHMNPTTAGAVDDQGVAEANRMTVQAGSAAVMQTRAEKITLWEKTSDPDLIKLIERGDARLAEFRGAFMMPTAPEVVSQTTATAYAGTAQTVHDMETPLLDPEKYMWERFSEMVLECIRTYDDEYTMTSTGGERHGDNQYQLKPGMNLALSAAQLKDFKPIIRVKIDSMTESERNVRFQATLAAYMQGFATKDEVLEARGITDLTKWYEDAAKDAAMRLVKGYYEGDMGQIYASVAEEIRVRFGIWIPPPGAALQQQQQLPPGGGGDAAAPPMSVAPPATEAPGNPGNVMAGAL